MNYILVYITHTHTHTHTNKCPLSNFILYSTNRSSIAIHVFIVMGTAQKKAGAPEDAAGAENENIDIYRGNQVMVAEDADHLRVRISPALIEFDNEDGTYDVIYATGKRESGVARIRIIVSNMRETITGLMPESESEPDESSYDNDDDDSSDSSDSDDS